MVAPGRILVAPTEAAAWTDLQSGHTEYKDLQSDKTNRRMDEYRIANANTQCGRITNPTERTERKSDRAENVPGPGTFLSGPLVKKSGPLVKKSGPLMKKSGPHFSQNNLFWFPGNSHSSLITHLSSLITYHFFPGATKKPLTRVSRARASAASPYLPLL